MTNNRELSRELVVKLVVEELRVLVARTILEES